MTPERKEKMLRVLKNRQPNLTVILENVNDPHNIAAVLRTCDAVGILEVYTVNSKPISLSSMGKKSSASAKKWIKVHAYDNVKECFTVVKKKYKNIYGTHLNTESVSIYNLELSKPIALAFGNEHDGLSEEALALCDGNFIIPQTGMIHSLNISVACAVSLYEVYRQRELKGMYQKPHMTDQEIKTVFKEWEMK